MAHHAGCGLDNARPAGQQGQSSEGRGKKGGHGRYSFMYDGGDISRHERIDRPHSASLSMNRAISHGQAGRSWAFRG